MKKILHEGKFKRFVSESGWEYLERVRGKGVVVIVPKTDRDTLIFVEQYRVPVGKTMIEFPAGIANDTPEINEESLEQAARRELNEETGYEAEKMIKISEGPVAAASLADLVTVFYAKGLKKVGVGGGDETESIVVHEVGVKEVDAWIREMLKKGREASLMVYSALYSLNNYLRNENLLQK